MATAEIDRIWAAGTEAARRYVMLALRLDRHLEGVVDGYLGPPGPAAEAAAGDPAPPGDLLGEADALVEEVPGGWLGDQVAALRSVALQIGGHRPDPRHELRSRYGVVPGAGIGAQVRAAHRELDALLPGEGALGPRLQRWREAAIVPPERVGPAVREVLAAARAATAREVPLPDGEGVDLVLTEGAPWMAYCEPLGGLRSTVTVNVDVPVTSCELAILTMHETYPGHHAERCCKEARLLFGEGRVEEAVVVAPSPQSVVSEGIAEAAPVALLSGPAGAAVAAALARAGAGSDLAHALAVERARMPLRWAVVEAGLLLNSGTAGPAAVEEHLIREALVDPPTAARLGAMLADPAARGYEVTYAAGAERCAARLAARPADLRTLLTTQVRVADLAPRD